MLGGYGGSRRHHFTSIPSVERIERWTEPCLCFLLGVGVYLNREPIPLSLPLAVAAGGFAYAALGEPWFLGDGPYFNTALATVVVGALALLSWHCLEKPALGLKRRCLHAVSEG